MHITWRPVVRYLSKTFKLKENEEDAQIGFYGR